MSNFMCALSFLQRNVNQKIIIITIDHNYLRFTFLIYVSLRFFCAKCFIYSFYRNIYGAKNNYLHNIINLVLDPFNSI